MSSPPPGRSGVDRRKKSIVGGEDMKGSGVSELVARMMIGAGSKSKIKRGNASSSTTTDELAQRWHKRATMDHSTKVVTSLGDSVLTVAMSEDETMFVGAGTSRVARVFATQSGEQLAAFELTEPINAVALTCTATGPKLITGDLSGTLSVFDLSETPVPDHPVDSTEPHPKRMLNHAHGSAILAMALPRERPDSNQFLIAVMGLDTTAVYRMVEDEGELIARVVCRINPMGTVLATHPAAISFDGDGHILATGVEKVVELWFVDERAPNRVQRPEVRQLELPTLSPAQLPAPRV